MGGRPRKLPNADEIRRLYHEEGMTTREIADKFDVRSTTQVYRLLKHGYFSVPSGTVTHPSETLPKEMFDRIPQENIDAWEKHRVCLCGCGIALGLRSADTAWGKKGEPSFFKPGHDRRIYDVTLKYKLAWRHSETTRKRMSIANLKYTVESRVIGDLAKEYRIAHGLTQRGAAREWGVDRGILSRIESGSLPRIKKNTAIKILTAIGEPIPEHLLVTKIQPSKTKRGRRVYSDTPQGNPLSEERHLLMYDGRAFQDRWGNVLYGRSPGEPGMAKCTCLIKSPVLESDGERKAWHKEHKRLAKEKAS